MSSPPFHVFVGAGMWHPADACRVNHQAVLLSDLKRRAGALRLRNAGARDAEQACEGAPARRGNGLTVRDCAPGLPGDDGRGEARPVIEREVRQRLDLLSVGCRASRRPDVEANHPAPRGSICQGSDWLESSTTNVAPAPGSDSTRSRPPILRVSSREMYSPKPVPPDKRVSCGPAR